MVRLVLRGGVNVDAVRALFVLQPEASAGELLKVLEILLEAGADIKVWNLDRITLYTRRPWLGIRGGASAPAYGADKYNTAALQEACTNKHEGVVNALLDAGVDIQPPVGASRVP